MHDDLYRLGLCSSRGNPPRGDGEAVAVTSPESATPPVRFGAYEVQTLLGRGSLGGVCRARHVGLNRETALKFLHPEFAKMPQHRAHFLAEARCMAALDHPNILPVYDVGEAAGRVFVAMKLMQGDLDQFVKAEGPLTPTLTVKLLYHLAGGLDELHRCGLIHRDVKPRNIFYDHRSVVLGDFGLVFDPIGEEGIADRLVGTPAFMPPELLRGESGDSRMDVYSLGASAFFFLTGRRPFEAADVPTVLDKVANAPTPSVEQFAPAAPKRLSELVRCMMDKDPARRPATALAVRELVQTLYDELQAEAQVAAAPRAARSWLGMLADSLAHKPTAAATKDKAPALPANDVPSRAATVVVHPETGKIAPEGKSWRRCWHRGAATWVLVDDVARNRLPRRGR